MDEGKKRLLYLLLSLVSPLLFLFFCWFRISLLKFFMVPSFVSLMSLWCSSVRANLLLPLRRSFLCARRSAKSITLGDKRLLIKKGDFELEASQKMHQNIENLSLSFTRLSQKSEAFTFKNCFCFLFSIYYVSWK